MHHGARGSCTTGPVVHAPNCKTNEIHTFHTFRVCTTGPAVHAPRCRRCSHNRVRCVFKTGPAVHVAHVPALHTSLGRLCMSNRHMDIWAQLSSTSIKWNAGSDTKPQQHVQILTYTNEKYLRWAPCCNTLPTVIHSRHQHIQFG